MLRSEELFARNSARLSFFLLHLGLVLFQGLLLTFAFFTDALGFCFSFFARLLGFLRINLDEVTLLLPRFLGDVGFPAQLTRLLVLYNLGWVVGARSGHLTSHLLLLWTHRHTEELDLKEHSNEYRAKNGHARRETLYASYFISSQAVVSNALLMTLLVCAPVKLAALSTSRLLFSLRGLLSLLLLSVVGRLGVVLRELLPVIGIAFTALVLIVILLEAFARFLVRLRAVMVALRLVVGRLMSLLVDALPPVSLRIVCVRPRLVGSICVAASGRA